MIPRTLLAATCAVLVITVPAASARAQELTAPAEVTDAEPDADVALRARHALATSDVVIRSALLRSSTPEILGPLPKEILSKGARTAIIVAAIVGGILLIAGVIVLAKPGKKLP